MSITQTIKDMTIKFKNEKYFDLFSKILLDLSELYVCKREKETKIIESLENQSKVEILPMMKILKAAMEKDKKYPSYSKMEVAYLSLKAKNVIPKLYYISNKFQEKFESIISMYLRLSHKVIIKQRRKLEEERRKKEREEELRRLREQQEEAELILIPEKSKRNNQDNKEEKTIREYIVPKDGKKERKESSKKVIIPKRNSILNQMVSNSEGNINLSNNEKNKKGTMREKTALTINNEKGIESPRENKKENQIDVNQQREDKIVKLPTLRKTLSREHPINLRSSFKKKLTKRLKDEDKKDSSKISEEEEEEERKKEYRFNFFIGNQHSEILKNLKKLKVAKENKCKAFIFHYNENAYHNRKPLTELFRNENDDFYKRKPNKKTKKGNSKQKGLQLKSDSNEADITKKINTNLFTEISKQEPKRVTFMDPNYTLSYAYKSKSPSNERVFSPLNKGDLNKTSTNCFSSSNIFINKENKSKITLLYSDKPSTKNISHTKGVKTFLGRPKVQLVNYFKRKDLYF